MKPPIKLENNGQSPGTSTSNILTHTDQSSSIKSDIKGEIKVEEKVEPIYNISCGSSSMIVAKGVIQNQTSVRPISSGPAGSIKEEEYDSSATVSINTVCLKITL